MEYIAEFDGIEIRLKAPTVDTLDKLEIAGKFIGDQTQPIKKRIRRMYDVIADMAEDKDEFNSVVGKFETADANVINLLYFSLIKQYKKPITDYQVSDANSMLESLDLSELKGILDALKGFDPSRFGNKNGVPFKTKL